MKKIQLIITSLFVFVGVFSYNTKVGAFVNDYNFHWRYTDWTGSTTGTVNVQLATKNIVQESVSFYDVTTDGGLATNMRVWIEMGKSDGSFGTSFPMEPSTSSPYLLKERSKIGVHEYGRLNEEISGYDERYLNPTDTSGNPISGVVANYVPGSAKLISKTSATNSACAGALPPTYFSDSDLVTYKPGTDPLRYYDYSKPIPDSLLFSPSGFSLGNQRTDVTCAYVIWKVQVKQGSKVTSWPTASTINYGQTLASSALIGGSANVAGTFSWVNSSIVPNGGVSSQQVKFTPTDSSMGSVVGNVNVMVNKANQANLVLTATPNPANYGTNVELSTTGGSGTGDVSYNIGSSTGCTLSGSTVTITNASGTCSATATKAGDTNYNSKTSNTVIINMNKVDSVVFEWPTASNITYGKMLANSTLSGGSANVAGTFEFTNPTIKPTIGTSTQSVTFTPVDTNNYTEVVGNIDVTVTQNLAISEISWTGSTKSADDEWIELYNATDTNIDLTNYVIEGLGVSNSNITLNGTICSNLIIPTGKYFIISNFQKGDSRTMLDVTADCVTTNVDLVDSGKLLTLKDNTGYVLDSANRNGSWYAGTTGTGTCVTDNTKCRSMVRNMPLTDGTLSLSWHSAKVELNLQHNIPVAGYSSGVRGLKATPGLAEEANYEAEYLFTKVRDVADPDASNGYASQVLTTDNCSTSCYVTFGPGSELETAGKWYRVDYKVKVSDNTSENPVVRLTANHDGTANTFTIYGNRFTAPNTYQTFSLYFKKTTNTQVDYSVWSFKIVDVMVDKITVTELSSSEPSMTYQAEDYQLMSGIILNDANASNGIAVRTSISAPGSSLVSWNVNTPLHQSGNYKATFYLKSTNRSQHLKVGAIEVYDRNSGMFLYVENIYSDDPRFLNTTGYFGFTTSTFTTSGTAILDLRYKTFNNPLSPFPQMNFDRTVVEKV